MTGTIVNTAAILIGSGVGMLFRHNIPEKYQQTIIQGISLSVGIIGLQMALKTQNVLIVIISLVVGAIIGESIDIEKWLNKMGEMLTARLGKHYGNAGQGFVTASLVFCVGAMAVVGAIQDGLAGNPNTLYAKAMLDGVFSVVLASSMGIGVAFSSIAVFLYQGGITLLAAAFGNILCEAAVLEMTAAGGILLIGISMIMLDIKPIRVANLLPAIPVAAVLAVLWPLRLG
jgi:uncharacterized membrane protein YqgA involved in biofilm formation